MWIISFFPDFVTHLIVILGALGIIASLIMNGIPFVAANRVIVQIVSVLVLGFGLYLEGGLANDASWKAKVAELENKVAQLTAKSAKVNTVIVKEVVEKKRIIREKGKTITEYVDREVKVYDRTCPIPKVVVNAHNAAAKNDTSLLIPTAVINDSAKTPSIKLAPKK